MPEDSLPKPTCATPEGVAYALLECVVKGEWDTKHQERTTRSYWLTLYSECLRAVVGTPPSGTHPSAPTQSAG
jgi:hypothetical protein